MSLFNFFRVIACMALFTAPLGVAAETLTLGSVSENIKKHLTRFGSLATYLQQELAADGITSVDIIILPNTQAMTTAMRSGEVDLFFDSPLVAARVAKDANAVPFLRRWKDGVASYHSVIIVPSDSDIGQLADLRGRRIGFQEPDSTSGYLLPAALIRQEGHAMQELRSHDAVPADHQIGYVFTLDDKNTVSWLHRGWIDAAATDPTSFEELKNAFPGRYRAIARSVEVPRQAVVRGARIGPALTARISKIMTEMHLSEDGRAILFQFNETDRFDHFPGGAEATFAPIHDILTELASLGLY